MGGHECLHSHLHAGLRIDRRRHELEAGHWNNFARQCHRADSDDSQCPRGRQVRHPVSGVSAGFVWRARRECARRVARFSRLRMVRNPILDRRAGYLFDAPGAMARCGVERVDPLDLFLFVLAFNHGGDLARHRYHQVPGRYRRAVHAGRGPAIAVVDRTQSRRTRPRPPYPK